MTNYYDACYYGLYDAFGFVIVNDKGEEVYTSRGEKPDSTIKHYMACERIGHLVCTNRKAHWGGCGRSSSLWRPTPPPPSPRQPPSTFPVPSAFPPSSAVPLLPAPSEFFDPT